MTMIEAVFDEIYYISNKFNSFYFDDKIKTKKDILKIFKIGVNKKLSNIYNLTKDFMENEEKFSQKMKKKMIKELRKYNNKEISISYRSIKISNEKDIKIKNNEIVVLRVDESIIPFNVYISLDLHAKILERVILYFINKKVKMYIEKLKQMDNKSFIFSLKIAFQPLFALAIFYVAKYSSQENQEKFFSNYDYLVNNLMVETRKYMNVLEEPKIDNLEELFNEIKELRNNYESVL